MGSCIHKPNVTSLSPRTLSKSLNGYYCQICANRLESAFVTKKETDILQHWCLPCGASHMFIWKD